MQDGEHRQGTNGSDPFGGYSFPKLWWVGISGFTGDATTRDYWFPAIIGFAELAVYPVFIETGQPAVIGAWLALKTAGQWGRMGKVPNGLQ